MTSTSKTKGKKVAVKSKRNDQKGKKRQVDESVDEDENPVVDALREKESGIEDEAVERFPGGGKDGLDLVRASDHSSPFTSH